MNKKIKLFLLALLAVAVLLAAPAFGGDAEKRTAPTYKLSVTFDLTKNSLKGRSEITFPEAREILVSTGSLRIISATFNGNPVEHKKKEALLKASGRGTLEINYEGVFKGERTNVQNLENIGVVAGGVITAEGISLTGDWYPSIRGLAYYELSALVPSEFTAISEAEEITYKETQAGRQYSFSFSHPLSGISFVAGHYSEIKSSLNCIDVYAYFFPEDISLAAVYVEHAKEYLKMYNTLLIPYPYKRFSVVENILPTGYSMPTFTLLGRVVVRLPFIVKTSLGHEITHQWFGNYVYADFGKGNWLEAITTYLSDHLYEEREGKGWEYRKKLLTDYQSYVTPEKEFPLRDFTGRTDFASEAIGYGKGAMLFHMLRNLVGEEVFYRSIRQFIENNRFRRATWDDIKRTFERNYGQELGWFFGQWLDRKDLPSIIVKDPRQLVLKGAPSVSFELGQKGEPYRLSLPLKIIAGGKTKKDTVELRTKEQYYDITVDGPPRTLSIDADYDVMRKLLEDEVPPVISRLLGDEKKILVYSEKDKGIYGDLIDVLQGYGFTSKDVKDLKDEDIRTSSLLVLDYESPVLKRLFGEIKRPAPGFFITVKNNPLNTAKVVAFANGDSREEVSLAAEKIFHYGKYTTIRFEKGNNVGKEIAETDRGMVSELAEPVVGIVPKRSLPLTQIINELADKPVIFIGERHTNYEDHKVELDVIAGLFNEGKKLAIGMEMFQRPFQKAIDDYISGAIGEREFLKKTEYFKRWRFDYSQYREIIEFARAKNIPVVALNLREEIINKVASGGLDALSAEEKKEIPQDMDMSDYDYRQRLGEIFESHPRGSGFDNFYQSQILWDETMAHSVAEFLKNNPDRQIVVLSGAEHVMYGSGIPQRLYRLTHKEYATVINGSFDEDIGNYVVFATPVKPPYSAKIGVMLKKKDDRVVIEDFSSDSAAEEAGMKKGDVLLQVDDWKIGSVEDVKIALFDKKPFAPVHVKAMRKRFLGEKEMAFDIIPKESPHPFSLLP